MASEGIEWEYTRKPYQSIGANTRFALYVRAGKVLVSNDLGDWFPAESLAEIVDEKYDFIRQLI